MNEILTTVFLVLIIAMLALVMVLIIMNLYEIFEEPEIQKRMRKLRTSSQPWVTVLIYARDNQATIETSLASLIESDYVHYDIIVVNDRSKDSTARLVRSFIKRHSKIPITLVNRQKKDTAKAALEAGYRKSKRGKIVISLRASVVVSPDFMKRAVATKGDKDQVTLRLNDSVSISTLSGITRTLNNLIWLQSRDVVVSDSNHITPTKLDVRLDALTVAIFLTILCVSILTNETIIIWYSWVIITSYLCAVIWLKNEGLTTKIKLTFSAVSAMFVLPVSSLIQGVSQFRSRI